MSDIQQSPAAGTSVAGRPSVPAVRLAGAPQTGTVTYQDVFVRDNFGDTGVIPSTGVPYRSPDIIPYQEQLLTFTEAISSYPQHDIGLPFVQSGTNNIYVRAINDYPGVESGSVRLYYSQASLFLQPSQWVNNQVFTAAVTSPPTPGISEVPFVNQDGDTSFNPGDILLTQEAFSLASFPSNDHYCFIAVVNTPNTTVTIPTSFTNNAAFVQWVQNTPAVAWRNVTKVPATPGAVTQTFVFGNSDSAAGEFLFQVEGKHMPANTTVSVTCTDQGCPISQTLTLQAPDGLGHQMASFEQVVPANFSSVITAIATPPAGEQFDQNAKLHFHEYQFPPANMTDLHLEVGRFYRVARTAPDGTSTVVSQFLIQIGACTLEFVAD
ncbi:MAG TPA: hypothetical protein VFQ39_18220 [Longimicrobium sp.]|nr:hypothetical protein [Longimicrobium sp.]